MIKDFSSIFWGHLPPTKQPYQAHSKVNAFIGPSGHGKTTIWDGLRLMLGATSFESKRPFWFYVYPGSNWAILRVAFWNLSVDKRRPFEIEGYREDQVTACCQIYKTKQDSWTKDYYLFDGEFNELTDLHKNPKAYQKAQLTETEYLRKLKNCLGITKEFRNLMSMSPDTVRDVVNSNPNKLFNLIFDLKGTKTYKERYDESKARLAQERINIQVAQGELSDAERNYKEVKTKAERFAEYQRKTQEVAQNELQLRKLEYYEAEFQIEKNGNEADLIEEQLKQEQEKVFTQTAQLEILKSKLQINEQQSLDCSNEESEINEESKSLNTQKGRIETILKNLEIQIERLEKIEPQDLETLIQLRDEQSRQIDELRLKHLEKVGELKEARNRLDELDKNKIPYKKDVKEFRKVLQEAGIDYLMLADAISIRPEMRKWQEAVEALLGNNRYRIIVDSNHYLDAKRLQECYEYGSRVCLPKAERGSADKPPINYPTVRSVLNISYPEKVEGYLKYLDGIYLVDTVEEGHEMQMRGLTSITARGLLQDNDGAIYLKYHNLCCGKLAVEQEKIKAKIQHEKLMEIFEELEQTLQNLTVQLNEWNQVIQNQEELKNLAGIQDEFLEKDLGLQTVLTDILENEKRYQAVKQKTEELNIEKINLKLKESESNNIKGDAEKEIRKLRTRYLTLNEEVIGLKKSLADAIDKLKKFQLNEEQIQFISSEIQTPAFSDLNGNRFTSKYFNEKLNELREEQRDLYDPSVNENIVTVVKAQEGQVEKLKERLDRLEKERDEWEEQCRDLLDQLKNHIKGIMKEYIAEFQILAELLKAIGKGKLEEITPDPETWELHLAIGFDGKKPSPIDGPDLSSGQKACTSLMLLLAALNSQKGEKVSPIMFLDEPKARVDDDRGNEIGQLLQVTDIQYFITHQQGESLKSIDWIDHAYSCSAREVGQQFAKPLIFKRARRSI
ncbi:hypothetical protein HMPREF0322_03037 [Desulfitobacterium hafniense DP7]|uniref:RecF/RecN/SMC protein n=1 Tax=Desulfitobacterium hafniense DP7 TaxID=537010 RepID=G9XPZ1_DESHA|nr:hypothetical protein [Desulfitobacterium hafniense]EHL06285.1 hypothetical protein HMPREF0322_03037 [Desulfitobacterium hafniense DP7]